MANIEEAQPLCNDCKASLWGLVAMPDPIYLEDRDVRRKEATHATVSQKQTKVKQKSKRLFGKKLQKQFITNPSTAKGTHHQHKGNVMWRYAP